MWISLENIFHPQWTEKIESEVLVAIEKKYGAEVVSGVESRLEQMREAIEDPIVTGYEFQIDQINISTDQDDRHVVASAYHTGAEIIVTQNTKHFLDEELKEYNLRAQNLDDFLIGLFGMNEDAVLAAVKKCREGYENPKKDVDEFLDLLKRNKLESFVEALKSFKERL